MVSIKKAVAATVGAVGVAAMLGASAVPAAAAPRHWHGGYHDHGYRHHRHDNWGAPAAGIIGLGAGLAIGSALASPPPPPPPPAYYDYGPPAWSPDWYAYCTSKYRSFNPRTGYFVGYDGDYHFCR